MAPKTGADMRFDSYDYLWPPRPENAIPRPMISYYERRGWVAQAKKNGTCNVLAVAPNRALHCMNRHKAEHKLWSPTAASSACFRDLPGHGWYVFVAELLHSKVEGIRDTNFIHDILVADGRYLVGMTLDERQDLLADLFLTGPVEERAGHYVLNERTWLAKNERGDFMAFFDRLNRPEDEGIVLKDPKSKLALCLKPSSNAAWQVKSRRVHKNYTF
jgi:hypothetical protein